MLLSLSLAQPHQSALYMADVLDTPLDVLASLEELDIDMGDAEDANKEPNQAQLNRAKMQAAMKEWQRDEKDSGSAEVQVNFCLHLFCAHSLAMSRSREGLITVSRHWSTSRLRLTASHLMTRCACECVTIVHRPCDVF